MSLVGHWRPVDPPPAVAVRPLCLRKRTNCRLTRYVRLVPKADIRIAAKFSHFNHLVGAREQRRKHSGIGPDRRPSQSRWNRWNGGNRHYFRVLPKVTALDVQSARRVVTGPVRDKLCTFASN